MNNKTSSRTACRGLKKVMTGAAMAGFLVLAGQPASVQASTVTVHHAGKQIELPATPQKTVVLDLALLDVLHTLNVPVAGVPRGRYAGSLESYGHDKVVKTGSMFEPDADAIRALQPDLIIAGRRSTKAFDSISGIAPSVNLAFDQQNLVDSVVQTTRLIAEIYNRQDIADPALETLQESVRRLRDKTAHAGTGLLVFTTSGKMISQGPQSRFGVLFNDFGVQPAMTEFPEGRGVELTAEQLHRLNPDWVYVIDRDAGLDRHDTPAQQLLEEAGIDQTTAGQKGRVVYLDPYNWYMLDGAGLTAMQENVDQLLDALTKGL